MEQLDRHRLSSDAMEESDIDAPTSSYREARKLSIYKCIESLTHACQCREPSCSLPSCLKMKRVVTHTKSCRRKTKGDCPICKQLIALCCYHAKHCQETKCSVPFCMSIKQKLKQCQLLQLEAGEGNWRRSLSEGLRDHYVRKLVAILTSNSLCGSELGNGMDNIKLVTFSKKIEIDMFMKARSRHEYYNLMAENIVKFQKCAGIILQEVG